MLFCNTKAEVTVQTVDNGWIVRWERKETDPDEIFAQTALRKRRPQTSGIKLFTTKKAMMKFLEDKL